MKKLLLTIVFFAFCTASFFFILYVLFFPQVDRYKPINYEGVENFFYMDTATGKIYTIRDGKLRSYPKDNKKR